MSNIDLNSLLTLNEGTALGIIYTDGSTDQLGNAYYEWVDITSKPMEVLEADKIKSISENKDINVAAQFGLVYPDVERTDFTQIQILRADYSNDDVRYFFFERA